MKPAAAITWFVLSIFFGSFYCTAQTVFWTEDFDDGGGVRWVLEDAPGSKTNPTPSGISGLVYGTNDPVRHDNWVINDQNTPELDGNINAGVLIYNQGQFVRGHHYDCAAPSDLPNPFINNAQPGPNQSLHITAYPTCNTLLFAGTAQSDDWNCISDPDNGDDQTLTEQIAYLNNNIDATGKCNLVLTADFFLGGDADGVKAHGTILYSTDAGATWKILEDNMHSCSPFLAGTCNNWNRISVAFPADANNQNDLRIAFRWVDDGDINDTGDYALGASFNVDNVMISACDIPMPTFIADKYSGCKNETFTFTDQTQTSQSIYINCFNILPDACQIVSRTWSISPGTFVFVNGTNANSQNPQIQFTANGIYSVTLTATTCGGTAVHTETNLIMIANCPPAANFSASQVAVCAIPASSQEVVTFTSMSTSPYTPITSYTWSFSPGTVTYVNATSSSSQNPQVIFNAAGTYQVTLTVTSADGSDSEIKSAYIEALDCNCGGSGGGGPVTIWSEDFDGNGGAGSRWGTLNQNIGVQGSNANLWYISDQESGMSPGECGTAGMGDQSLHVGAQVADFGAAYEIGCATGCFWCDFFGVCIFSSTNKRSFSQNINTTGFTSLTLGFNYIEGGQGSFDNAVVQYSINGGTSWLDLSDPIKTDPAPCSPQGIWTSYSIALPVSCENISNLKIAFRWQNNEDASGVDPSFAVDDIVITGTGGGGSSANTWQGDVSNDWNTAGNWSTNAVPTSTTDVLVPSSVCGTCAMPQISAAAVAKNVCNFGVITITTNNTLTIDQNLLNEGQITTTTVNSAADVIFANTASVYKGSGTLYDVDVAVTSSDLTLETDMRPRSFSQSSTGTVNLDTYILSVNRNFTKTAGIFIAVNGRMEFVNACGSCLDQTNTSNISINADQIFGDVLVNKSNGVKVSLVSALNYTLNTPKTLTIQNGILDANTFTLNGTGNLTMTGGELQMAKCTTVLPELTGTYTLTAGKVTLDGTCSQSLKSSVTIAEDYYKLEFNGSGIKFLTGNTNAADSILFRLPTTAANYVNATSFVLSELNSSSGVVYHSGGHVVGDFKRAITPSGGIYTFYVGSTNADMETYFEPIQFTPNNLLGPSAVTAKFLDATPNPANVMPIISYGLPPAAIENVDQVETEGYWRLTVTGGLFGGTYTASVSPDATFWTFDRPWNAGYHTLLKQSTEGDNWDYSNGGARLNDSTTISFTDFSNYVLAYAMNPLTTLAVELTQFKSFCENGVNHLVWSTASEKNSNKFVIESSTDGADYDEIGQVNAAGTSTVPVTYEWIDQQKSDAIKYYRLSEINTDGESKVLGHLSSVCSQEDEIDFIVYPNPSNGQVNVSVFSDLAGLGNLKLLSSDGKMVYQSEIQIIRGITNFNIVPNVYPGLYILYLDMGTESKAKRITFVK